MFPIVSLCPKGHGWCCVRGVGGWGGADFRETPESMEVSIPPNQRPSLKPSRALCWCHHRKAQEPLQERRVMVQKPKLRLTRSHYYSCKKAADSEWKSDAVSFEPVSLGFKEFLCFIWWKTSQIKYFAPGHSPKYAYFWVCFPFMAFSECQ